MLLKCCCRSNLYSHRCNRRHKILTPLAPASLTSGKFFFGEYFSGFLLVCLTLLHIFAPNLRLTTVATPPESAPTPVLPPFALWTSIRQIESRCSRAARGCPNAPIRGTLQSRLSWGTVCAVCAVLQLHSGPIDLAGQFCHK